METSFAGNRAQPQLHELPLHPVKCQDRNLWKPHMNPVLADLLQVLQLERLELNLFRASAATLVSEGVRQSGAGQALSAASSTVEGGSRGAFATRVFPPAGRCERADHL
jgi:hypothetical protein